MNKYIFVLIHYIIWLVYFQCNQEYKVNTSIKRKISLKYELTTCRIGDNYLLIIFQYKFRVKYLDNIEYPLRFAQEEKYFRS